MFIRYQLRSGERGGARASTTSGDGCLESRAAPRGSIPRARKAAPTLASYSTDSQAGTVGGYGFFGQESRADTGGGANTLSAHRSVPVLVRAGGLRTCGRQSDHFGAREFARSSLGLARRPPESAREGVSPPPPPFQASERSYYVPTSLGDHWWPRARQYPAPMLAPRAASVRSASRSARFSGSGGGRAAARTLAVYNSNLRNIRPNGIHPAS